MKIQTLSNEPPKKQSEREQLAAALDLSTRIENDYEDYLILMKALQYDQDEDDNSLYSKDQLSRVEEMANELGVKLLKMIEIRNGIAAIIGQNLPDSKRINDIREDILKKMERLSFISPYRTSRLD